MGEKEEARQGFLICGGAAASNGTSGPRQLAPGAVRARVSRSLAWTITDAGAGIPMATHVVTRMVNVVFRASRIATVSGLARPQMTCKVAEAGGGIMVTGIMAYMMDPNLLSTQQQGLSTCFQST